MGDSVRWVQFLVFVWDDEKVPEMDGDVHSNVNVLMPLNCTVKHSENGPFYVYFATIKNF